MPFKFNYSQLRQSTLTTSAQNHLAINRTKLDHVHKEVYIFRLLIELLETIIKTASRQLPYWCKCKKYSSGSTKDIALVCRNFYIIANALLY